MSQTKNTETAEISVTQRSRGEKARRKTAHMFATCAMAAWVLLGAIPFVVVIVELS